MQRGRQLIGLPVVELSTGRQVTVVRSLLFDRDSGELVALVLQKDGRSTDNQAIKIGQVHAIGRDAVILSPGEHPVALTEIMAEIPQAVSEDWVTGRPVLTSSGRMLGTLTDLGIDLCSRRITELILSDGLIQDLIGGYSAAPASEQTVYGDEHIIVPEVGDGSDSDAASDTSPQTR